MALTQTGILIPTADEILQDIKDAWTASFGDDFDVSTESDAVRLVEPIVNQLSDAWELLQQLYDSFDEARAEGAQLDNLGRITGTERRAGSASTAVLRITGDAGTPIPEGYTVEHATTGTRWATTEAGVLPDTGAPAGTETLDLPLAATELGAVSAAAGTLTIQITVISGVVSVTNPDAATPGTSRETDPEYRVSRRAGLQSGGTGTPGAIYSALLSVPEVQAAVVINNPTDATDANGVPPRATRPVVWPTPVDPDVEVAIATALAAQLTGPLYYDGTEEFEAQTVDGQTVTVRYALAADRRLRWRATITPGTDYPATGDALVQEQIGKFFGLVPILDSESITQYQVGEDIVVQDVLCNLRETIPGIRHITLEVDDFATAPPTVTTVLTMGVQQVGTMDDIADTQVIS